MSDIPKGPRIALVGSCQTVGIRAALLKMRPDAEVRAWHLGVARETKEDIAGQLGQYDLIVSQVREADPNAPLALPRLKAAHKNVQYVPIFVFNGFHPDCIHLQIRGKKPVGPLNRVQSAIIACCYVLGVPEAKVARLFNSLIYGSLGYFEAFDAARSLMLKSYSSAGFDLAPQLDRWRVSGSFMHSMNHPRIEVLTGLAHMIGVRAGFIEAATALPENVQDGLANGIHWPVYPEIARRLGLPKERIVFRFGRRELDLATTVREFYRFYEDMDRADMRAVLPARLVEGMQAALET